MFILKLHTLEVQITFLFLLLDSIKVSGSVLYCIKAKRNLSLNMSLYQSQISLVYHLYSRHYLFLFFFRNKSIVKQLELKIAGLENYKKQLQVSETAIGQQKKQRSDHKKLTIFWIKRMNEKTNLHFLFYKICTVHFTQNNFLQTKTKKKIFIQILNNVQNKNYSNLSL